MRLSEREQPPNHAELGLLSFRRQLDGPAPWQRGDRALTLHMLRGLAPVFFEQQQLEHELNDALEKLTTLSAQFPLELDLDQAMSQIDALYLCQLYGRSIAPFDPGQLTDYIDAAVGTHGLLPAWLMGEQTRLLGVSAQQALPAKYPFVESDWILHLYFLTHLFMLESDYFLQTVAADRFDDELAQLERALPPLISHRRWDLLAEVQICLASCSRSSPRAQTALQAAQRSDGSWTEPGYDDRQIAHTTAACLLAMAH